MGKLWGILFYILMIPYLLIGWLATLGIIGYIFDILILIAAYILIKSDSTWIFIGWWVITATIIGIIGNWLSMGVIWWFVSDITAHIIEGHFGLMKLFFIIGGAIITLGIVYLAFFDNNIFSSRSYNLGKSSNGGSTSGTSTINSGKKQVGSTLKPVAEDPSEPIEDGPIEDDPDDLYEPEHPSKPSKADEEWRIITSGSKRYGKRLRLEDYNNPAILAQEITSAAAFKSCYYKLLYWKRDLNKLDDYGQAALNLVRFALSGRIPGVTQDVVRQYLTKTVKERVDKHKGWDGTYDPVKSVYWGHRTYYLNLSIELL